MTQLTHPAQASTTTLSEQLEDWVATAHEQGYLEGRRRTAINALMHALGECSGLDMEHPFLTLGRLAMERQETIATIRNEARRMGIKLDFDDDSHLSDIIEKGLIRGMLSKDK